MAEQSTPKKPLAGLDKAWDLYYNKKFDESRDVFSGFVDTDDRPDALYGRACALFRSSDHEGALADLSALVSERGKVPSVLHTRGLVHGANENYALALKDLRAVVGIDPLNVEALCDLGGLLLLLGRYGEAMDCFDKAADVDKKCSCAWFGKAMVAFNRKQRKSAGEYVNVVLKLDPRHVPALLARAEISLNQGKKEDAMRDVKKALSLDGDFSRQFLEYLQADEGTDGPDDSNGLI